MSAPLVAPGAFAAADRESSTSQRHLKPLAAALTVPTGQGQSQQNELTPECASCTRQYASLSHLPTLNSS